MSETIQRLPEPRAPHETVEAVAAYLRDEVRGAHAHARDLIRQGKPGYATFLLTRSVHRQARILGLRLDVGEVWTAMAALPKTPGRHAPAPAAVARTWPPRPLVVPPAVPGALLPVRRTGGA